MGGDGERLLPTFITIACFCLIVAMMISMSLPMIRSGAAINEQIPNLGVYTGDYNHTWLPLSTTPPVSPITSHNVTNATVFPHIMHPYDSLYIFYDEDATGQTRWKYVQIIRNNDEYDPSKAGSREWNDRWKSERDYIAVRVESGNFGAHSGLTTKWRNALIPLVEFEKNFDKDTNSSTVDFRIGDSTDSIQIILPNNDTRNIWWNNFQIYYGWSNFRVDQKGMLATVGEILKFEMPDVHPVISKLLGLMIWMGITFIGISLITRIIPF